MAKNLDKVKILIKEAVESFLREADSTDPEMTITTPRDSEEQAFEEDPVNYILKKYPTLKQTLVMLMSNDFKDYITGIYIIAPKPTTFKVVLHNGREFYLAFMGKAYEAKVEGRKYFLLTIGEKERATLAIARLLKTGNPVTTKGPAQEESSNPEGDKEDIASSPKTAPEGTEKTAEEESTES